MQNFFTYWMIFGGIVMLLAVGAAFAGYDLVAIVVMPLGGAIWIGSALMHRLVSD